MAGKKQDTSTADKKRRLVIVESPTKAKKIADYLGKDYIVESSVGHIRDLPRNAADIPKEFKGEAWARLGVNIENDFSPLYVVSTDKKSLVTDLKKKLKEADELYLATDGDREGEAIAWHLYKVLKPTVPYKRMVFNEITKPAIIEAANHPRDLDMDLVDAQESRRILDRLYGYEISPVLWKKVMPKLSAGRVQSVATKIIVDRERQRMKFITVDYWDIELAGKAAGSDNFTLKLNSIDNQRVASGRDFTEAGEVKKPAEVIVLDEATAVALAKDLLEQSIEVTEVSKKPYSRKPYAPFTTSTLQQEAGKKLKFSSNRTMRIAQRLYENGYITYMRTDSTVLSVSALTATRNQIVEVFGEDNLSSSPRTFNKKVKNAQEAHEAIRPAGDKFVLPKKLTSKLSAEELKLYELIWQRTLASQMAEAKGFTLTVRFKAQIAGKALEFSTSGRTITFPGFLAAYADIPEENEDKEETTTVSKLPNMEVGQQIKIVEAIPAQHKTQPPARYTEASLVKTLEELGIGRPSTYASIISTIQDRGYVMKRGTALVPSWVAFAVVGLLEQYFSDLVDYTFTAEMEDSLDAIAAGKQKRTDWLHDFYFGDADLPGLKQLVGGNLEDIDAREINSIYLFNDQEGRPIYVRVGRYGPYLEKKLSDTEVQRANLRESITPDELTLEVAEELFAMPVEGRVVGVDPETGLEIVVKDGRFGPYVAQLLPEESTEKPKMASLFKNMDPQTLTLEQALQLLSLPREVGVDPETGEVITAQNGRYGPYLKRGTDSRSLASEDELFTINLEQALEVYKQPKTRGRSAPTAPLKELGEDPETGLPVVVKDGRFGPYVTDGKTNASLRKGDSVEEISIERASELLADRRAKGPVKRAKKATSKKATTKKTSPKKKASA